MARRRLIWFVVVLAVVAACAAVAAWVSSDSLSSDEKLLVGRWRFGPDAAQPLGDFVLGPDRECLYRRWRPLDPGVLHESIAGRWSLREGVIYVDLERNPVRRGVRPLAYRVGIDVQTQYAFVVESVTADTLIIGSPNGDETWIRAPAD
jgi:hypothetical protein